LEFAVFFWLIWCIEWTIGFDFMILIVFRDLDMFRNFAVIVCLLVFTGTGFCGDWSQWHGPNRDNLSTDTGLLKSWPKGGPSVVWSVEGIGKGFSTVSVADGFIYITGLVRKKVGILSKIGLDGKIVWQKPYGGEWYRSYDSTRTTPTINDGCAYIMSGLGEVVCMDIETGKKKWSVNTFKKYGGKIPHFGVAESVVVDDTKVYCLSGGKKGSIFALNKKSGKVLWTTKELTEKASYCSAIVIDHHGKIQLITLLAESMVGIDIATGKVLWKLAKSSFYNQKATGGANIVIPIRQSIKTGVCLLLPVITRVGRRSGFLKIAARRRLCGRILSLTATMAGLCLLVVNFMELDGIVIPRAIGFVSTGSRVRRCIRIAGTVTKVR
jgi:outer membrane protein assembly factor BamB